MSILLIYPPFGLPFQPYISVAVLASYLRAKGVDVSVLDANLECFRALFAPDNIHGAAQYAENRLVELNEKAELAFLEALEFHQLLGIMQSRQHLKDMSRLFDPGAGLSVSRRKVLFKMAVRLISMPFFPEAIKLPRGYMSPFNEYSSGDILRGTQEESLLSGVLELVLASRLQRRLPRVVGISICMPAQVLPGFRCARIIKRMAPQVHVTLGGAFISCHMRNIENTKLFDIADSIILDDGELPLEKLMAEFSGKCPDLSRVPGLSYVVEGKIRRNGRAPTLSAAALPAPDYRFFPLNCYLIPKKSMTLLFKFSRGCQWGRCAFCETGLPMISEYKQPEWDHLYEQLLAVVHNTETRNFFFTDESVPPPILRNICRRLIDEQVNIAWRAHCRFDRQLTLEQCRLYRRSGCWHMNLGLESYNSRLLALMAKGTTTQLIDQVLSNFAWAGIPVSVYMMVGFPTETEQEARDSFQKVKAMHKDGLIANYDYTPFQITPNSRVAAQPERYGITDIYRDPNVDLSPPVLQFKSPGMSRDKALHLAMEFNASRSIREAHAADPATVHEDPVIAVERGNLSLNFLPDDIARLVDEHTLSALHYSDWLKKIRKTGPSLKRSRPTSSIKYRTAFGMGSSA